METSKPPISINATLQVSVSVRTWLADDIVGYEFTPLSDTPLPDFEAGAHIDVHLPGGLVRQYSLYDLPTERPRYRIGVLRDPQSRGGSVALHDSVNAGDTLTISVPRNHFALHSGPERSILFAGGIGITPIICMAQQLAHEGRPFDMHYCGRSLSRMALVDRAQQMSLGDEAQVHVHADDGPPEQQLNARAAIGAPSADKRLYVCGPTGFMDHILQTARELGWEETHLHREYFAGAPIEPSDEDGPLEIEIHSSGEVIEVAADQSVAHALLDAGFDLPLSCEQGVCGTCMTRVLAGVPDHRDLYLTDDERTRNDCFMPCCSRAKTSRLLLDL
ncbi:oxidoreductase [Paraburkholderia panacisoli]|uniref:Oxidoreductase n=1 Tax=Paraburkholderia panacisoli TaxID=2603818 RepID=A0A5B0GFL0_9BURK|nr:PDR/VanB family oxidoreductase [Paraburkholderia panacisoli]KAA1000890.1 oxidoreductase [Paraburkholderia panacisoli]